MKVVGASRSTGFSRLGSENAGKCYEQTSREQSGESGRPCRLHVPMPLAVPVRWGHRKRALSHSCRASGASVRLVRAVPRYNPIHLETSNMEGNG